MLIDNLYLSNTYYVNSFYGQDPRNREGYRYRLDSLICKTPTVKKCFKIPPDKNLCVWSQYVKVYT